MATSHRIAASAIVIGSGWGQHAAETLAADPRIALRAIVGRGSPRTRALAERLRVTNFVDLAAAIHACKPSIVAVSAGAQQHGKLLPGLMEAGCRILCSHPVLHRAEDVQALQIQAQARERVLATDYTLRLCDAYVAAERAGEELGPLLRMAIRSPSRPIVMAVDLAIALAGPVETVRAITRYPAAVQARAVAKRASFAPTMVFEHAAGCVTTIVPMPHSDPANAFSATASYERGRLDVALPAGAATLTRRRARGTTTTTRLTAPAEHNDAQSIYGAAMRRLVTRFVDACIDGAPLHAPLSDEIRVRATWEAAETSAKQGGGISVVRSP